MEGAREGIEIDVAIEETESSLDWERAGKRGKEYEWHKVRAVELKDMFNSTDLTL